MVMRATWRECPHCNEERLHITLSRAEAEQLVAEASPTRLGMTGKLFGVLRNRTGLVEPKRK